MFTDLEMLNLADIVYERFKKDKDYGFSDGSFKSLREIFNSHDFFETTRKARWEALSEEMKDWKLIDAFDLAKYTTEKGLAEGGVQTQREQFYAAAFQKGDGDIVIAYRGTDGDNGDKDFKLLGQDMDFYLEHFFTCRFCFLP